MCLQKKISVEMELETSVVSGIYIENIQQAVWLSRAVCNYLNLRALFLLFLWKVVLLKVPLICHS